MCGNCIYYDSIDMCCDCPYNPEYDEVNGLFGEDHFPKFADVHRYDRMDEEDYCDNWEEREEEKIA